MVKGLVSMEKEFPSGIPVLIESNLHITRSNRHPDGRIDTRQVRVYSFLSVYVSLSIYVSGFVSRTVNVNV